MSLPPNPHSVPGHREYIVKIVCAGTYIVHVPYGDNESEWNYIKNQVEHVLPCQLDDAEENTYVVCGMQLVGDFDVFNQKKIEKDEEFFSYFPEDNDFATHDTLKEAKESAQASLEWYQEDACDDGWNESVTQVCYGKVMASPIPTESYIRADYTDEEWDNKFPNNSNHDNVVVYSFDK